MAEYYLAGGGLRLFQTIIYASLWIVIGCFVAAVFRRMLGADKVRSIFADHTRYGLLVGWLIGMLLPVCSLGVIPVVREMHRCGVKRGTIVAFGLTAPLFNPMSVLYGLTLSDPIAILSFSLCALIIVSIIGASWNRFSSSSELPDLSTVPDDGLKRSIALFYTASRELVGPSMVYMLIGIAGSVLLAILLPKGYLQLQVEHDNTLAPISVALIASPIYSTPLLAMSQIGGMFQHGNSIGAAFSLLILGAGANLGLLAWIGKTYGYARLIFFYVFLATITIGLAYVVNEPLYPKGVDPAGHTHAFDVYTHPFDPAQSDMYALAKRNGKEFWIANEYGGTVLLALLILIGALSCLFSSSKVEAWLLSKSISKDSALEKVLPGWLLGVVSVVGLVVASVVGCYLYYPAPKDLFRDLAVVNADAVLTAKNGKWESANKWIRFCDDLSRRLEVGVFLRNGSVGEFQSQKAKVYREKLDELKTFVEAKEIENAKESAMEVAQAYLRLKRSFNKQMSQTD